MVLDRGKVNTMKLMKHMWFIQHMRVMLSGSVGTVNMKIENHGGDHHNIQ